MIMVKPRTFIIKFLNESEECYPSLKKLTEALQPYTLEKLKKIADMKLMTLNDYEVYYDRPGPIPEDW